MPVSLLADDVPGQCRALQCIPGLGGVPLSVGAANRKIHLGGPASFCSCAVRIPTNVTIVTNGYPLLIFAPERLEVEPGARILAFEEAAVSGLDGDDGERVASYDPGPNTEGNCTACTGLAGGNGEHGGHGQDGQSGSDAAFIAVVTGGEVTGTLFIDNSGQDGGDGGDGGDGSAGGNGQQGGRGETGIVNCRRGAGHGGAAGLGGDAGRAGQPGSGGDGGRTVVVIANVEQDQTKFGSAVEGGVGGLGGKHGKPGVGGIGGYGGRGSQLCGGEEERRKAPDANGGKSAEELGFGSDMQPSEDGRDGAFEKQSFDPKAYECEFIRVSVGSSEIECIGG